ncbi:MAG: long-chain fatty acid--CoA ligase [Spirochaetales bacterium]|nr:long-chain fatty acid--CoA ligase [Spirochaetales bacterium]
MANIQTETLPRRFRDIVDLYSDTPALMSKDTENVFQNITFRELWRMVEAMAKGLSLLGIKKGSHVGIISDNRKEWIISDLAVLSLGAVDVPRGSDSTAGEIGYILDHSDSEITFAENPAQVEKIVSDPKRIKNLKKIIVFEKKEQARAPKGIQLHSFDEIMLKGREALGGSESYLAGLVADGSGEDLATLIYTSGTTGDPKGVMLTHQAFLFQVDRIPYHLFIKPGQVMLSVLPIWHSFERAVEYLILLHGLCIAYSKPVGAVMLPDMAQVRPQWLPSVPRIWEGVRAAIYRNIQKEGALKQALFNFFVSVGSAYAYLRDLFLGRLPNFYGRIRILQILVACIPLILLLPLKGLGGLLVFGKLKAKLGGKFIAGISGGGALPPYVDNFFRAAGILLIEGYGLTETAPVTNVRMQNAPVPGTVGPFLPDIEYKLIGKNGETVGPGGKGVLHIRSPQVMNGYYKRPDATEKVLNDGWLNTGDICMLTFNNELKIIGREKETIVLLGGENIEPVPIEEKLKESSLIDEVVIVGQDRKFLAALIIPNFDEMRKMAEQNNISWVDVSELCINPQITGKYHEIIQSLVNTKSGFKPFEQIFRFTLLPKEFEVGVELTNSLKVRRNYVFSAYNKEIDKLFR